MHLFKESLSRTKLLGVLYTNYSKDLKGLDIIRYYGNQSVHTGEINLEENMDSIELLFDLANYIVDDLIGKKQKIDEQYSKIPHSITNAISNRDGQS